jgi:hypothetical protein
MPNNPRNQQNILADTVLWARRTTIATFVLALSTFVLACATIFSSWFIYGQWSAAVDAQKDTRTQLQAFVTYTGTTQIIGNNQVGKTLSYYFVSRFQNF